jgi:hypothetical protein
MEAGWWGTGLSFELWYRYSGSEWCRTSIGHVVPDPVSIIIPLGMMRPFFMLST